MPGAEFAGEPPDVLRAVFWDEDRDLAQPVRLVRIGMRAGARASTRCRPDPASFLIGQLGRVVDRHGAKDSQGQYLRAVKA